jgi:hypothetical protein
MAKHMAGMLDAGLLRIIILVSIHNPQNIDTRSFLTQELLSRLAYSALHPALHDVQKLQQNTGFRTSAMFVHWWRFTQLEDERIAVWDRLNSPQRVSLKACDDLEVSPFLPTVIFPRSSVL